MEVAASAAKDVKRVHLELGGKAPVVVFEDADIAAAAEWLAVAGYFNAGQDCTAATRVLVAEQVYDINEFLWLQHEAGQLKTDFKPQAGRYLPYHTSCHQKLHRIGRPALDLLGTILGLPESDYPRMLRLTQELFGAEDEDFKRDESALLSLMQENYAAAREHLGTVPPRPLK